MTAPDPGHRLDPGPLGFPTADAADLVRRALDEDLGPEHLDVTTLATIPADQVRTAEVVARAAGVVAGLPVLALVFGQVAELVGVDPPAVEILVADGAAVSPGDVVARVTGPLRAVLIGERTMLNVVSRLSGVATHTRRWADALEGCGAMVLDTRKTTPGMRHLEKYAVRAGGGTNKRMGLYDVAMIKDNHKLAAGSVGAAYAAVHAAYPTVDIQVEVTTVAEAHEAYAVGARFIMCDNMSRGLLADTVNALREKAERVEIEATGNLTVGVARAYAETGVDFLSVGGLTHSSPILDLALDLVAEPPADKNVDVRAPVAEEVPLPTAPFVVRALQPGDRERWWALYRGYTTFYEITHTDEMTERVWQWLFDPDHDLQGFLVEDESGRVVGLAHVRPFPRPLHASVAGFLDDLFVEESARGTGAAQALLARLRSLGEERGWSTVRWITSESNLRARGAYDKVATALPLVTYDMPVR